MASCMGYGGGRVKQVGHVYAVERMCIQVEAWLSVGGRGVWVGYGMGETSGQGRRCSFYM